MALSIAELQKAASIYSESAGIDLNGARRIVAGMDEKKVLEILAGACTPKRETRSPKKKKAKSKAGGISKRGEVIEKYPTIREREKAVQSVGGPLDLVPLYDGLQDGELPADFGEVIQNALSAWCERFKVEDITKASAERWSGFCMMFGFDVRKTKLLYQKDGAGAGQFYDAQRVDALASLWVSLCLTCDKIPLAADFINFSGVSKSWFFGDSTKGVTSAGVGIWKRLSDVQEMAIGGRLVDGRKNPTGSIFFLKNVHGWRDQREVVHTDGGTASLAGALPVFSADGGELIAESGTDTGFPSSYNA